MNAVNHTNLSIFYSATHTKKYLLSSYERLNIEQAQSLSYENCYPFIYHIQHGQLYLDQAKIAPLELKPFLLFYGLVQLLKSMVITTDPFYPDNSQVLAHGVSTRKRKKNAYEFLYDEVKTQKNGLFPHFLLKLFHMKHLGGEKYSMLSLLQQFGDMHPILNKLTNNQVSISGRWSPNILQFPSAALDHFHMTKNRFEQYIQSISSTYDNSKQITELNELINISLTSAPSHYYCEPWVLSHNGTPFLLKDKRDTREERLPELATHYLLLYNLSMICRYETEWWAELINHFHHHDLPIILHYMQLVEAAIPRLIEEYLLK